MVLSGASSPYDISAALRQIQLRSLNEPLTRTMGKTHEQSQTVVQSSDGSPSEVTRREDQQGNPV
jgi:hypothetical protein